MVFPCVGDLRVWRIILCVGLLCCGVLAQSSSAEEGSSQQPESEKVDTVLLLDASGSMRRTDPLRLRDQGAKLITQFLKEGDRLAIVEFSEKANVIRPLSNFSEEEKQQVELEISKVGNSGIYTDLLTGIKTAHELLKQSKRDDASPSIVLLSDGQMDPNPQIAAPADRMRELEQSELPTLREEGIKLHTISLSELSDKQLLSRMALETDAVSWHAPTADSIQQAFAELFLAVKKPQVVPLTSKGFPIDEGINEATFYINKANTTEPISLETPNGRKVTAQAPLSNMQWYQGTKFDVVTIQSPEIGNWKVVGLPIADSFATVLTNLKLVADWQSTQIFAGEPSVLKVRFFESKKPVSLPELSGIVEYSFEILPIDKVSEPIIRSPLVDDGRNGDEKAHDAIFSSTVTIDEVGEYRLTVSARGPTFVRQQQLPFRVKPRMISVEVVKTEEDGTHSGENEHETHDTDGEVASAKDSFLIELSEEVTSLRDVTVDLRAVDSERHIFNFKPIQSKENRLLYTVSVGMLPKTGDYTVTALLSGEDKKKKKRVRFSSNELDLEYADGGDTPKEEIVEIVKKEEVKVEEGPPAVWPYVLLLTLLNLGAGGGALMLLRKAVAGVTVVVRESQAPQAMIDLALSLKKKLEVVEVNPADPIFAEANLARLKDRKPLDFEALAKAASALAERRNQSTPKPATAVDSTAAEAEGEKPESANSEAPAEGEASDQEAPAEEEKSE